MDSVFYRMSALLLAHSCLLTLTKGKERLREQQDNNQDVECFTLCAVRVCRFCLLNFAEVIDRYDYTSYPRCEQLS
jgi:hypothetical protein